MKLTEYEYPSDLIGFSDAGDAALKAIKIESDDFYQGKSTDQSQNMDTKEINSYMEA